MNRLFLIAVSLAALTGCQAQVNTPDSSTASKVVTKMRYVRDTRTDECYATFSTHGFGQVSDDGMTVTWVPCTEKVLAEIKK